MIDAAAYKPVPVVVQQILPFGILVRLADGAAGIIRFVLDEVTRYLGGIQRRNDRPAPAVDRDVQLLSVALHDLARGVGRLTETARTFGRMVVQSREQAADLREVLAEVVSLTRDMADRAHVRVDLRLDDQLPPAQAQAVQLQQILLNVVINAIQQIGLLRPAQGGRVLVQAGQQVVDHRPLIRVRVEDDGPGIHRQLWRRVFDLGFTTRREGGSGMGLYITQSLAESLGARVAIAESAMLWGTTFLVDLPIAA